MTADTKDKPESASLGLDDAKATRNLKHGLISLVVLIAMAVGLFLAVPGLHDVAHQIEHMGIGWVLVAIGLEVLSCVCYVVSSCSCSIARRRASARAWR